MLKQYSPISVGFFDWIKYASVYLYDVCKILYNMFDIVNKVRKHKHKERQYRLL